MGCWVRSRSAEEWRRGLLVRLSTLCTVSWFALGKRWGRKDRVHSATPSSLEALKVEGITETVSEQWQPDDFSHESYQGWAGAERTITDMLSTSERGCLTIQQSRTVIAQLRRTPHLPSSHQCRAILSQARCALCNDWARVWQVHHVFIGKDGTPVGEQQRTKGLYHIAGSPSSPMNRQDTCHARSIRRLRTMPDHTTSQRRSEFRHPLACRPC